MKTDKKSPINLVPLFVIQNSKKDIRKSFKNTNYKAFNSGISAYFDDDKGRFNEAWRRLFGK